MGREGWKCNSHVEAGRRAQYKVGYLGLNFFGMSLGKVEGSRNSINVVVVPRSHIDSDIAVFRAAPASTATYVLSRPAWQLSRLSHS